MHLSQRSLGWSLVAALTLLPLTATAQQPEEEEDLQSRQRARLTKAPTLVEAEQPPYPQSALDARVEGDVVLRLTLDDKGAVINAEIAQEPGAGLGEAARQAALKFKFTPAEINNVPAPVTLPFTISFALPTMPGRFTGRISDSGSGKGLDSVTVKITFKGELPEGVEARPEATSRTDAEGAFSFENVPPGTYTVTIALDAYRQVATEMEIVDGGTSEAEYRLDAQPVNFAGVLREAGTRAVLPGLRVEISDDKGTLLRDEYTDEEGRFAVRGLPAGVYTIRASGQGYNAGTFKEQLKDNERTDVTYYVEAEYYDPYTIKTSARRERREVNKQTLKLEEVRRIPGTGGDVVRVIQNLPGVARPRFLSGALVIRGAAPRDSQVFLEGDNIPLVFHFFGGPAVINSEMIESIDFYAGNFSPAYGRALAGIINLNTRSPKTDRIHGMAQIDVLNASALIEGPITKDLSFAISGRRSYFDLFLNQVIPDDTVDIVAAPRYYDYQAWLTWRGFKDHKLELFLYGSNDLIDLILPEGDPQGNQDFQTTGLALSNGFTRLQFKWDWKPAGDVENQLFVSYGTNVAGFDAGENLFFRGTYRQLQLREELTIKLEENLKLRMGADIQLGNVTFSYEIPRLTSGGGGGRNSDGSGNNEQPNFTQDGALSVEQTTPLMAPAFYAELDYEIFKGLRVLPGARVDHYAVIGQTSFSPRLTSRWQINEPLTVKGGVGLFTQPPLPGITDPVFGNANVTFEKAYQYSAGVEWRPLEYIELDTTFFYRDSFDLITTTSTFEVDEEGEATPTIFNNAGEGRAYGAEILLRHYPNNRFFGWIAYTLSRSERRNLTSGEWQPFEFDQTHILTMLAGYNLPYGIDISARFRLVSGNPETPIIGSVFDAEDDRYRPVYGTPYSTRNATFRQLDFRVDKKWVFETWILGAYLDILNVLNLENAEGQRYSFDYSRQAPVLGLPIIPTIGVTGQF